MGGGRAGRDLSPRTHASGVRLGAGHLQRLVPSDEVAHGLFEPIRAGALREHLVLERRHHIRALAKRDHLVLQGLTRQVLLMQGVLGRTQCRL